MVRRSAMTFWMLARSEDILLLVVEDVLEKKRGDEVLELVVNRFLEMLIAGDEVENKVAIEEATVGFFIC